MNRIFSSVDSMFVAIYYAAIFLTPANVRGAARVIGALGLRMANCGSRIADRVRATPGAVRQPALILCAVMSVSAGGFGATAPAAPNQIPGPPPPPPHNDPL